MQAELQNIREETVDRYHLIESKIFLSTPGPGIARAQPDGRGGWQVSRLLGEVNVHCLAADPHDPRRLFAGTQQGLYISSDQGLNWQPGGLAGTPVHALAACPHTPGRLFAGVRPAGVHRSQDGGESWEELQAFRRARSWWWFSPASPPYTAYVQSLAVSPDDPQVLLAGVELGGVLRSTDGGQSWSGHQRGALRDCHHLIFHPRSGDWAYMAGGSGGGAALARQAGSRWQKRTHGLAKGYGVSCAADPQRPEVWYVAVAPSPGKAYGPTAEAYLYRASGGSAWQPIGWAPHPLQHMPIGLATLPEAPGSLVAGSPGGQVRYSQDYGETWRELPFNLGGVWHSLLVLDPVGQAGGGDPHGG